MPNQPKNRNKPVRVSEELWAEFGQVCEAEGTNRAQDLRAYMQRRVRRFKRQQAKGQAGPGETSG